MRAVLVAVLVASASAFMPSTRMSRASVSITFFENLIDLILRKRSGTNIRNRRFEDVVGVVLGNSKSAQLDDHFTLLK
jgi:hypothetical protein